VSISIYGRLADLYGPKPVFFGGTSLFLTASLLCGLAWSRGRSFCSALCKGSAPGRSSRSPRPSSATSIPRKSGPRVQGYLSGVFGVAAVLGPPLGAFIVEHVSWSFVFWINLPIGAVSFAMLALSST
jgi:MFS family permease